MPAYNFRRRRYMLYTSRSPERSVTTSRLPATHITEQPEARFTSILEQNEEVADNENHIEL